MTRGVPARALRPSGSRRGVGALAVPLVATVAWLVLAPPAHGATPRIPATQPLVALLADHSARHLPHGEAPRIETVAARRPLTRVRTVLPVLGSVLDPAQRRWLHVRLPGRPTGHTGWILADRTRPRSTGWHLSVDLSARRLTVHRDGRSARRFRAVVGAPSTPTPRGRFFVEEAVAAAPGHAGGPFALALSARSAVLQEFAGGPGQIAIHGTANLGDPLGTAASHGCVRVGTRAITWLARRVDAGTPVTVTR